MVKIEQWHTELIPAVGFDRHFDRVRYEHMNGQCAFDWLNDEYKRAFGQFRYGTYESYKASRSRRQNS